MQWEPISQGSLSSFLRCKGLFLALLLTSFFLSSCSKIDSNQKPVYPVKGRIHVNGKPVSNALVVFHPLDEKDQTNSRPHGQTGSDGTFTLTTFNKDDGAPQGDYAITVEWWTAKSSPKGSSGISEAPSNRLPQRYSRPKTSGLKTQIKEGQNVVPVLNLRSN